MRIAYLDCASGVSGDMMLGALVDAGVDVDAVQAGIDSLGLPSCTLELADVKRCGFRAAKVNVKHEPEHAHRHLHHITDMIDGSSLTENQRDIAKRIFGRLAEAEAKVHGSTIEKVHFHEVGAVDSIADIVGSAIAWDLLNVERIICSPVPTGHGFIKIAHGRCSIPAPATAEMLKGIPIADSDVECELTTPTGAAIISTIATEFRSLPPMAIETIGYGAGDAEFKTQANILRLLVGETDANSGSDKVTVIETNLDDVTGEVIGHCTNRLLEGGALDVYTTPIQMKKNRPAVKLTLLCQAEKVAELESILFAETRTLGTRRWIAERTILAREFVEVETPFGKVKGKQANLPSGDRFFSPEFESCKRLAEEHGISLQDVVEAARRTC